MKRFLVFLVVAIAVVSLGLSVYYFTKDNEVIYINSTYITLNKGNVIETDDLLTFKNASKYTKINYDGVKDSTVLSFNKAEKYYAAKKGGQTEIVITTSNRQYRNIVIKVVVRDGSEEYPYLIGSQADLLKIGQDSQFTNETNYELEKSFALNSKWLPLETFKGTFNGNGYTISNMDISPYTQEQIEASQETQTVNGSETKVDTALTTMMREYNNNYESLTKAGLFANLESSAVVSNLTLKGVNITGEFDYVGGIAAINKGAIRNCKVSTDSKVVITTTGSGEDLVVNEETIFNQIESNKANAVIGGVVGHNFGSTTNTPIFDRAISNAKINIAAAGQVIGGLVGFNEASKITESYYRGYVQKTVDGNFAGIAGKNAPLSETKDGVTTYFTADIIDCYAVINTEKTNAITTAAGLVGENVSTGASSAIYENRIFGNYWSELKTFETEGSFTYTNLSAFRTGDISKVAESKQLTVDEFKDQTNFVSYRKVASDYIRYWNFDTVWTMFKEGQVEYPIINRESIAGSVYEIDISEVKGSNVIDSNTTPSNFRTLLNNNKDAGSFTIKEDLDLTGFEWDPIEYYNGTLTGEKFTDPTSGQERYPVIKNLTIKLSTQNGKAGLFERLGANAIISNLTFDNVTFIGTEEAYKGYAIGTIAGTNDGANVLNVTITNVTNNLYATMFGTLFGLATHTEGHSIKNITVDNVVFNDVVADYAGGIIGFNGESTSKPGAIITGTEKKGNIPAVYTTVTNFKAVARKLGGITAINKGTIKYASATIVLEQTMDNDVFYDPALVPSVNYFTIYVGGIAGQNTGVIDYAKASSIVTLDTVNGFGIFVGGIAGNNYGLGGSIMHSYAYNTKITTKRTYQAQLGGIVGNNSGLIDLCVVASDCEIKGATSISTKANASFVGGIAGYIALGEGSKVGAINKSASYAKTVTGFYAGGIVGYGHGSVTYSFVEGSTVTGYYAGGLASVINGLRGDQEGTKITIMSVNNYKSGFYYTCYAIAKLNSVDNGGDISALSDAEIYNQVANFKNGAAAGFAVIIGFGSEVNNCYTVADMTATVKYSVSLNRYTGLTDYDNEQDVATRETHHSGVVVNSIYTTKASADEKVGGKHVDADSMKVSGNYTTLTDAGFNIDNWDLEEGQYPTIARIRIEFNKFFDYQAA